MCGRTACTLAPDEIQRACSFSSSSSNNVCPSWKEHPGEYTYTNSTNMAPSMFSPILYKSQKQPKRDFEGHVKKIEEDFVIQPMMWGFIPHFYKGECPKSHGLKTNNCRIEDVEEKKSYLPSLKNGRRCVVLAQGFYEWQTTKNSKTKQPYFVHIEQPKTVEIWNKETWNLDKDDDIDKERLQILKMAGLYSVWTSSQGKEVYSYTVVTMETKNEFAEIHHRIPAILKTEDDVQNWLTEPDYKKALSQLNCDTSLAWYPVSTKVNNSRNQDEDLMTPISLEKKPPPQTSSSRLMSTWLKSSPVAPKQNAETKKKQEKPNTLMKWLIKDEFKD